MDRTDYFLVSTLKYYSRGPFWGKIEAGARLRDFGRDSTFREIESKRVILNAILDRPVCLRINKVTA